MAVQEQYKSHFDKSLRKLPMPLADEDDHVDPQNTARTPSEGMADQSQSKLLQRTVGPISIFDTTSHTITIDEDGIENVI